MTVLCHDALGGVGIHLRAVGVLAGVVGVAVEEEDAVGVLLDGARVTQVGQLGAVDIAPRIEVIKIEGATPDFVIVSPKNLRQRV